MLRGQLTIEFLIILVVMLLLFNAVSMDLIQTSLSDSMSTQTAETIRSESALINATVNSLRYQASGAKSTINLRAPSDCGLMVSANDIVLSCDSASSSVNYTGASLVPVYTGVSYSGPAQIAKGKMGAVAITRT
jgi:hypothetical protein